MVRGRVEEILQNEKDLVKVLQEERENTEMIKMELESRPSHSKPKREFNRMQQQQLDEEDEMFGVAREVVVAPSRDDLHQDSYIEEVETQL